MEPGQLFISFITFQWVSPSAGIHSENVPIIRYMQMWGSEDL